MTEAQLLADQALPFADFPTEIFRYAGREFQCLVIQDAGDLVWDEGGKLDDEFISIAIERSQFEASNISIPEEGIAGIPFRGKSWRINNVKNDDAQSSVRLDLVSEAK